MLGALSLGFDAERGEAALIALMDECKEDWIINITRRSDNLDSLSPIGIGTVWHDLTGRQFLQNLGSHARQVFGDTFWIDQVLPQGTYTVPGDWGERDTVVSNAAAVEERYPDVDVLCITDLRYPNEAERIKLLGGVIWEVERPGLASDGHDSEQPLPRALVDYTIVNDDTLDTLRARVAMGLAEAL